MRATGSVDPLLIRGSPGSARPRCCRMSPGRSRVELISLVGFEAESSIPFSGLQRSRAGAEPPGRAARPASAGVAGRDRSTGRAAAGPVPGRVWVCWGCSPRPVSTQPVVCAIDDAHWLDPESLEVLAFVARRLQAESVAMLFALRDDPRLDVRVAGIPTLRLSGLDPEAAVALLTASLAAAPRPAGGGADRPVDRRQSAGPDRPRRMSCRSSSSPSRAWPTSRSRSVVTWRRTTSARYAQTAAGSRSPGCWWLRPTRPGTST